MNDLVVQSQPDVPPRVSTSRRKRRETGTGQRSESRAERLSSAQVSADWLRRSGCRPWVSKRSASKPATNRAVRAYVYRDQGFTFDAVPTVITAPHCLQELFELSGRRLEDYVRLLPVTPFYRLRWPDGVEFDYVGDEKELLSQIRQINPQTPTVIDDSRITRDVCSRKATKSSAGALCELSGHDSRSPRPDQVEGRPQHLDPNGLSLYERRTSATSVQFSPAAGRWKPTRDQLDLYADPLDRAEMGRLLPRGRHRCGSFSRS